MTGDAWQFKASASASSALAQAVDDLFTMNAGLSLRNQSSLRAVTKFSNQPGSEFLLFRA